MHSASRTGGKTTPAICGEKKGHLRASPGSNFDRFLLRPVKIIPRIVWVAYSQQRSPVRINEDGTLSCLGGFTVALKAAMTAAGTTPLPLAASGAAGTKTKGNYNPADGYWQPNGIPVITGYIKIDAQTFTEVLAGFGKTLRRKF